MKEDTIVTLIYIAIAIAGILITVAPLFIWYHVSKLRAELRDRLDEAAKANRDFQQRVLQYLDYLAQILQPASN